MPVGRSSSSTDPVAVSDQLDKGIVDPALIIGTKIFPPWIMTSIRRNTRNVELDDVTILCQQRSTNDEQFLGHQVVFVRY